MLQRWFRWPWFVFFGLGAADLGAEPAPSKPHLRPVSQPRPVPQPHPTKERKKADVERKAKSEEKPPLSKGRYIGAGILGSVVGLGSGHALVGEYKTVGWIFTTAEILSLVGLPLLSALVLAAIAWDGSIAATGDRLISIWSGFFYAGVILFFGFRIWQIVDIWKRPHSRVAWESATPSPASQPAPTFQAMLVPFVPGAGGLGLALAGSFSL